MDYTLLAFLAFGIALAVAVVFILISSVVGAVVHAWREGDWDAALVALLMLALVGFISTGMALALRG